MKSLCTFIIISLLFLQRPLAQSQIERNKPVPIKTDKVLGQIVEMNKIDQLFAYIPSGTFKMSAGNYISINSFYIMRVEMPNVLYRNFIEELAKEGKIEELALALPDTAKWNNGPYEEYYFRHISYNMYPVVSVPRKGVELFCTWLEEKVSRLKLNNWKGKKIKFRLPTEAEWMSAASGGDSNSIYGWKGLHVTYTADKVFCGDYLGNFRRFDQLMLTRDSTGNLVINTKAPERYRSQFPLYTNTSAEITAPVLNYWPNAYGLFCMSGNVREMVQEEGFTKGGSWVDPAGDITIDARNTWIPKNSPCIGFRLVAVVTD